MAPYSFSEPWWARGPHAQTLLARLLRSPHGPPFHRERFETPDGDFFDNRRSVCRELLADGVRPVAFNFRGCSGEPNRALRYYHSGDSADVRQLIAVIRERRPGRPVGGMGFSLGGNILLKMLGERPDGGPGLLDAAAAMSVPYDLAAGADLLERSPMGRLYSQYFLRSLRGKLRYKRDRLESVLDMSRVDKARTIREFDDRVTAPLNGFRDARHYYEECSSAAFLDRIRTPTLLLHAVNDPFLPAEAIPVAKAEANAATKLVLVERGGHVGFVAGSPWSPRFWGEESAARFLARTLRGAPREG